MGLSRVLGSSFGYDPKSSIALLCANDLCREYIEVDGRSILGPGTWNKHVYGVLQMFA